MTDKPIELWIDVPPETKRSIESALRRITPPLLFDRRLRLNSFLGGGSANAYSRNRGASSPPPPVRLPQAKIVRNTREGHFRYQCATPPDGKARTL